MRTYAFVLIGILGLATSALAQSPPAVDRATILLGTWSCASFAGSTGTATYVRESDGSIAMRNVFDTRNGSRGEFDETYRFDAASNRWIWSSTEAGFPEFHEEATAGPWTDRDWTFDGKLGPPERPLRMTYKYMDDASFMKLFEVYRGGSWVNPSPQAAGPSPQRRTAGRAAVSHD